MSERASKQASARRACAATASVYCWQRQWQRKLLVALLVAARTNPFFSSSRSGLSRAGPHTHTHTHRRTYRRTQARTLTCAHRRSPLRSSVDAHTARRQAATHIFLCVDSTHRPLQDNALERPIEVNAHRLACQVRISRLLAARAARARAGTHSYTAAKKGSLFDYA